LFNQKAVYGELKVLLKETQPQDRSREPETPSWAEEFVDRGDSIEIPKLNISAPLIFPSGNQKNDFLEALKRGVIHFPDSVLPGQNGVTIILGHSAPANWPEINYDWVFSNISRLIPGDEIFVFFNHRQYVYKVGEGMILERSAGIPSPWLSNGKPTLILISCWPPGKDYKRYGVVATINGI